MESKENTYLNMINQNQALIYKIASLYTDKREDRQDLIQDIHLQLWNSLDSFGQKSKMSTWLYRISLNTAIHFIKKKSRLLNEINLNENNVKEEQIKQDHSEPAIQKMLASIQTLNELDKGIILLYLEEKSHKEIAEIIGLSVSNIGTRIQRIKIKLSKLSK